MNKTRFQESAGIRGFFRVKVYRKGKLIETFEDSNLIVKGARTALEQLVAGNAAGKSINRIAFGTSGSVPTPDDTAITGPFVKPFSGVSFPDTGGVEFSWDLLSTEANGKTIMEFGLLCADGTLYARRHRTTAINKDSDIALEGQWIINF
ncbi:MAG: hypothetical protein LBC88_02440 [Spirochaetaceae bacterium]|jgi:hypothetical protein|nr:hypothetical protein [Spirochaetaceae bacterium]